MVLNNVISVNLCVNEKNITLTNLLRRSITNTTTAMIAILVTIANGTAIFIAELSFAVEENKFIEVISYTFL